MARIIVFQHHTIGTPGRIGMTLRDHGFKLDIRRLDLNEPIPPDLDDVHGLLIMGGPQNVGENHDWMPPEQEFIRNAHDAGIPVVGVCLGAQLIAIALGGQVGPMDQPECGFHPVDVQFPGQTDSLLAGLPWHHVQFQTHGHEIKELPHGAQLLMSGDACKVQAFKIGQRTIGMQFHPEFDRTSIETVHSETDLFQKVGLSMDELNRQLDTWYEQYARLGNRLALNLTTLCFPFANLLAT